MGSANTATGNDDATLTCVGGVSSWSSLYYLEFRRLVVGKLSGFGRGECSKMYFYDKE